MAKTDKELIEKFIRRAERTISLYDVQISKLQMDISSIKSQVEMRHQQIADIQKNIVNDEHDMQLIVDEVAELVGDRQEIDGKLQKHLKEYQEL